MGPPVTGAATILRAGWLIPPPRRSLPRAARHVALRKQRAGHRRQRRARVGVIQQVHVLLFEDRVGTVKWRGPATPRGSIGEPLSVQAAYGQVSGIRLLRP